MDYELDLVVANSAESLALPGTIHSDTLPFKIYGHSDMDTQAIADTSHRLKVNSFIQISHSDHSKRPCQQF